MNSSDGRRRAEQRMKIPAGHLFICFLYQPETCPLAYLNFRDAHLRLCGSVTDWEAGAWQLYNHVRKLSLSSLVAANTDSMSLRMSELSASCRLGISSSPSMFMASPSSVPRSTFVPGMASR